MTRMDMGLITFTDDEIVRYREFFMEHYNDSLYFTTRRLASDFLDSEGYKTQAAMNKQRSSRLGRKASGMVRKLQHEGKIEKFNTRTWKVVR